MFIMCQLLIMHQLYSIPLFLLPQLPQLLLPFQDIQLFLQFQLSYICQFLLIIPKQANVNQLQEAAAILVLALELLAGNPLESYVRRWPELNCNVLTNEMT